MAGATYRILISEEGSQVVQTKPTVGKNKTGNEPKKITKLKMEEDVNIQPLVTATKATMGLSVGLGLFAVNEYFSITGQEAQKNQLQAQLRYGTVLGYGTKSLMSGNIVGAGIAFAGAGVMYAKDRYEYAKEITESNAMAEYLRQQSNTSVNGNRGDYYSFNF